VTFSTVEPRICILLQSQIGNDEKVAQMLVQEQNRLIEMCKPSILQNSAKNYISKEEILQMDKIDVPSVTKEYKDIVDGIKQKAKRMSQEHIRYASRFDNLDRIVGFINLVKNNKYADAYKEIKTMPFLPIKGPAEPDLYTLDDEVLLNLPDVIFLALIVIQRKLKDVRSSSVNPYSAGFNANESDEAKNLKSMIDTLRAYYTKIEKVYMKRLNDSSSDSMKKLQDIKSLAKEINIFLQF
jgi:hypothetical protein